MQIIDILGGTSEADIIYKMSEVYEIIEEKELSWINAGAPTCIDGCGGWCCAHFEPHIMECEAIYLASWLLSNQEERAKEMAMGSSSSKTDGCILFDAENPYHCTVYGGRCLICRLFGYCGDRGKDGTVRFKPCKFLPEEYLLKYNMKHRQYTEIELKELFNALPPLMAECTFQATSIIPGNMKEVLPLREALPKALQHLMLLASFSR